MAAQDFFHKDHTGTGLVEASLMEKRRKQCVDKIGFNKQDQYVLFVKVKLAISDAATTDATGMVMGD